MDLMRIKGFGIVLSLVFVPMLAACDGDREEGPMSVDVRVTAAQWQSLASQRIVFGHQSVGRNILNGVRSLAEEDGVDVPIIETRERNPSAGIAHFAVGRNGDPFGKIRDFATVIDGGAGDGADVALMKLCYVDFPDTVDPPLVATAYGDTLESLARRFPDTRFVAVTAPLITVQTGPKATAKKLLGLAPSGCPENARRQVFNDNLRQRFGARGRLFDLAAIEAAGAKSCTCAGRAIQCLNPDITYDGGHLNEAGARLVAAHLIDFLTKAE